MFTGIIRHVGSVVTIKPTSTGTRLIIDIGPLAEGLDSGDSVAVNGACLTAADFPPSSGQVGFDVVAETLGRTTLGEFRQGKKVNLERALKVGATLDGHLVQGHVDGIATVQSAPRNEKNLWTFKVSPELAGMMAPKGSVAIDGVSLTLVDVEKESFSVALIPTTLRETTLGGLSVGNRVNIETDLIGKYVMRYLKQIAGSADGGLTLDKLRQAGFM